MSGQMLRQPSRPVLVQKGKVGLQGNGFKIVYVLLLLYDWGQSLCFSLRNANCTLAYFLPFFFTPVVLYGANLVCLPINIRGGLDHHWIIFDWTILLIIAFFSKLTFEKKSQESSLLAMTPNHFLLLSTYYSCLVFLFKKGHCSAPPEM